MPALIKLVPLSVWIALAVAVSMFAWHKLDKGSAVRQAVTHYVADVELEAAEAETRFLRERIKNLTAANEGLKADMESAEKEADDAELLARQYLLENPAVDGCAVSDDLIDLLRSN